MIADGRVHRKPKATSAGSVNGAAHFSRRDCIAQVPSLHSTRCMRRRRQTEAVCSAATSSMKMGPNTNRRKSITSGDHSTVGTHGLDTAGSIWICTISICTIRTSPHRTCCDSSASRPARHAGVAQWRQRAADAGVSRGHKRIRFRQRNLFAYEKTPDADDGGQSGVYQPDSHVGHLLSPTSPITKLARRAAHRESASL